MKSFDINIPFWYICTMKIRLPGVRLAVILPVFVALISIWAALWYKTTSDKSSVIIPIESGSSGKLFLYPELSEIDKKRQGLLGPFPVGAEVPEQERRIGLVVNAWRQAVVMKRIKEIEQWNNQVVGYGSESVPFLKKLAAEDENERVRAFAVRVIGRMHRSDLDSFFIMLLQKDRSPFVRENAAWSLGELGNGRYIDILQSVANNDESDRVRQTARESITTIKKMTSHRNGKE